MAYAGAAMPAHQEMLSAATRHLKRKDPVLRAVIERVGPCKLRPARDRFHTLVRSIIAQQISGSAARTITGRLEELMAPKNVSAEALAKLNPARLRKVGVSPQKAGYLADLADKVLSGAVRLDRIARRTDAEVIAELIQVKGIGVWTAEMFLIFSLGRPDVLPCDDLGLRSALRNLYKLTDMPSRQLCDQIALPWRPYASVATWYCWRSLDLK
jgi:DNA-3-methyladenine glycosylase II